MDTIADGIEQGKIQNAAASGDYFRSSHERLAYSFASYAAAALPDGSILAHEDNVSQARLTHGPSLDEARGQAGSWNGLFEELEKTWWTGALDAGLGHTDVQAGRADKEAVAGASASHGGMGVAAWLSMRQGADGVDWHRQPGRTGPGI